MVASKIKVRIRGNTIRVTAYRPAARGRHVVAGVFHTTKAKLKVDLNTLEAREILGLHNKGVLPKVTT